MLIYSYSYGFSATPCLNGFQTPVLS